MSKQLIKDWMSEDPVEFNRMDTHNFEGADIRFLDGDDQAEAGADCTECEEDLANCEAANAICEQEKQELQDELDTANGILEGSCFAYQTILTDGSGGGQCQGSIIVADSLLCYAGEVNNRYTFSLVTTKENIGEQKPWSCGQKIAMWLIPPQNINVRYGGSTSRTIELPSGFYAQDWGVHVSNSNLGINDLKIGTITLGDTGNASATEPTYHPPFSAIQ